MDRVALILDGDTPVNAVVIAQGKPGDDWLEAHPDVVEVTGLDPMPGVGAGWIYDGEWVAPPVPEVTLQEQAVIDARQSAIEKLEALGLTVDEVQAAFGLNANG